MNSTLITSSSVNSPSDWLILGAGISGLILGSLLIESGQTVQILEKSKGVGGRLATRRIPLPDRPSEFAQFDHGLPIIELNHPGAIQIVEQILGRPIVESWLWHQAHAWGSSALRVLQPLPGMNALAKALPASSLVHRNQRVIEVQFDSDSQLWTAKTSENNLFSGRKLVITFPIPQFLELQKASRFTWATEIPQEILSPQYAPAMSFLVIPKEVPSLHFSQWPSPSFSLVVENQWKGISHSVPCFTFTVSGEKSAELFDLSDEDVTQTLLAELRETTEITPITSQVHRWRYSRPTSCYDQPYLALSPSQHPNAPPLLLCGDYFGEARISPLERAILSAVTVFREQAQST